MAFDSSPSDVRTSERGAEAAEREFDGGRSGGSASQKKKLVILAVLGAVAIGVVAHQFLRGKSPKAASATTPSGATAPSGAADAELETVLKRLEQQAVASNTQDLSVARVEQLVKEFDGYVRTRQVPLDQLQVNPFTIRLAQAEKQPEGPLGAAEARNAEARRLEQIRAAAKKLTLGSVLVAGGKRLAMINGQVCGVGDTVTGFTIQEIEPNRVVLECDGVVVDLELYRK